VRTVVFIASMQQTSLVASQLDAPQVTSPVGSSQSPSIHAPAHGVLHALQCATLVSRSTQTSLHRERPGAHAQRPSAHTSFASHTFVQEPQWPASDDRSKQSMSAGQKTSPGGHRFGGPPHIPDSHATPMAHIIVQSPQWSALDETSVH
jgi:hypothetical protein